MPIPEITLNAVTYYVKDGRIRRTKVDPEAPVVSIIGTQSLGRLTSRSSHIFPPPTFGVGLVKIPSREVNNEAFIRRSAVSELDTRFEPTTLPRLQEDSTEPTQTNYNEFLARTSVEYKDALWALWDFDASGGGVDNITHAREYTGSSTSWTGGGEVIATSSGASTVSLDLAVDEDEMVALVAQANDHLSRKTTDGVTWATPTTELTANKFSNAVTDGENIDGGVLVKVPGGALYAVLWGEGSQTVAALKSTDQGNTWTSVNADDLHTGSGIKGRALYYDLNGDLAPVITIPDGIYAYDTSADVWHKLVSLASNKDNGRGLIVWNNPFLGGPDSLYCPLADGTILEYTWISTSQPPRTRIIGPNIDGGIDSDQEGHVTASVASFKWLFFAMGGNDANKKAVIWAYDGKGSLDGSKGAGFHFMHQTDTANRKIDWIALSNNDDDNLRLHFSVRTAASTGDTQFIQEPLAHPKSGVTIRYEATGVMDRPRFNGGMPRDDSAWIAVYRESDDLSASNSGEYINLDYGVNGDTPSTDIGDILSGAKELSLESGAGVSGKEFQLRENFTRDSGDTSQTPKAYDLEILYRKKPASLDMWMMTLDLRTADSPQRSLKTMRASIETAESNVPLQAFTYSDISTRYVTVKILGWTDKMGNRSTVFEDLPADVEFVEIELREVV